MGLALCRTRLLVNKIDITSTVNIGTTVSITSMEQALSLTDKSGVAEARRATIKLAQSLGFSERYQAAAALVASEAATNIIKYAGRGEILLRPYMSGNVSGIELLALDRGPGIANLDAARRDGFSTGGSLGAGLGTMARQSHLFDIYSVAGAGTAVLARIQNAESHVANASRYSVGTRSTPKANQEVSGDAWGIEETDGRMRTALLDGLGHGPLAADASRRAVDIFRQAHQLDTPASILRHAHEGLKGTRGAVMAVAQIDTAIGLVHFAGVGNIVGIVVSGDASRHLLSTDGTVGYNMRLVREVSTVWTARSAMILTTDGLSTRWNLSRHPGLVEHHPSLIAAVLHRDFARDSDDATVVVVKAV
jgi:anti-sigma regulatory factor (Ser/Thr protein kinase)